MGRVIGLGLDLVDIDRISKLCEKGMSFAEYICTTQELAYCSQFSNPAPSLAARFAAKEAVSKALGTGIGAQCSLKEVEIVMTASGAPQVLLHGGAAKTAADMGIAHWSVSLTHSRLSAAAVVVASD